MPCFPCSHHAKLAHALVLQTPREDSAHAFLAGCHGSVRHPGGHRGHAHSHVCSPWVLGCNLTSAAGPGVLSLSFWHSDAVGGRIWTRERQSFS
eukprot:453367-Pelagomonas_calceolata.AAC.4